MVPRTARSHYRSSTSSLTGVEAAQADRHSHNTSTQIRGISTYTPGGHQWIPQGGIWLNGSLYLRGIRTTIPPSDIYPPPSKWLPTPRQLSHVLQPLDIHPFLEINADIA